jgi:hypothetical protein
MPNPTKKKNPNIVQLVKGGSFTVQDADRNKALVCKEAFPWLYDLHNDPESCLELDAGEDHDGTFQLLESSVISRKDHGTNTAHDGDENSERAKIESSMNSHGFKLWYPPVCTFKDTRIAGGEVILIDRRTTDKILVGTFLGGKMSDNDGWGYTNLITDRYRVKKTNNPKTNEPWTKEEILDEISLFGQAADIQNNDPKGKITKMGFLKEFVRVFKIKLDSGKYSQYFNSDRKPLYDVVRKRLDRAMGDSGMADGQRDDLCWLIINQFEEEGAVISWSTPARAKNWLTSGSNNFKDIKPTYDNKGQLVNQGIKYLVVGSSQYRSSIVMAAQTWNTNKDYMIRVIIQTETLTGYSLTDTYWKRLKTFREYWYNTLNLLSSAYFGDEGPFKRHIELYGAIPAYKPIHDLDKLVVSSDNGDFDNSEFLDEDLSDDDITTHEESKRWKQK